MAYKKKLIEVSIPLEVINSAAVKEKSMRHGHPSSLHLWWARRPLATARAVLFASLVDDPSEHPEIFDTEEKIQTKRKQLHKMICDLVQWENINNEELLNEAREEIRKSCDGDIPTVWDPFCGGGTIPLEAQRLGLPAIGSDLNPVAVMITKAMIEIPPLFANKPPVNPGDRSRGIEGYKHAAGLAADVRYYGEWIRNEAAKSIGHLYPEVEYNGRKLPVIAWIYARTVKCSNPACGKEMPLISSFMLSKKPGRRAYIDPHVEDGEIRYQICSETDVREPGVKFHISNFTEEGTIGRLGAVCLHCGASVSLNHIRAEGRAGKMSQQFIAIVADGGQGYGRVYLPPNKEHENAAKVELPVDYPKANLPNNPRDFKTPNYGMSTYQDLFTPRQLTAMVTFSDLVEAVIEKIHHDALDAGLPEGEPLREGGKGALSYGQAVGVYLTFLVDQLANHQTSICGWHSRNEQLRNMFARQAIPMTWDYAVSNPFCDASGGISNLHERMIKGIRDGLCPINSSRAIQRDATIPFEKSWHVFSTDPPYYDNIGYADLSDFFYIWMRRSLKGVYPELFRTMQVPKAEELVASPYRFKGNKNVAQSFFEDGLYRTFQNIHEGYEKRFPVSIYYAYKQREEEGKQATGWETMLQGVISAGFKIVGTWPMRTEMINRSMGQNTNALASSIVLVCRPREDDAPICTRRDLSRELTRELPCAVENLQQAGIAPVDMAQSSIGPGMAIFSQYAQVLESDGTPMTVRSALALINETLSTLRLEQSGHMGPATGFCADWFEQFGYGVGSYGDADQMSRGHNTVITQIEALDVIKAQKGKVQLVRPEDLPAPNKDDFNGHKGFTAWWAVMQMAKALDEGGEEATAKLMALLSPDVIESAKALCYCLYDICDRKGRSADGRIFNALITCWEGVGREAEQRKKSQSGEQISWIDL